MAHLESRNSLLAKIHIAKKCLALSEETYRDMVLRVTGQESCGTASHASLVAMVAELRAKGWKGQSESWLYYFAGPNFSPECVNLGKKIRAILLDTERSWNYAHGIAKRMHGKRLEECAAEELKGVIGVLMNASRGRGGVKDAKPRQKKERATAKKAAPCADAIKTAVLAYYRFQRKYPYVATECWECDVVASDGARLVDVEVKISWNDDYRREFAKSKHTAPESNTAPAANRKYFAAPTALAERIASDEEAAASGYGVIAVDDLGLVSIVRKGKDLHREKIPSAALHAIALRLSSELITIREKVKA